jgi:hypothetical protein
MVILPPPPMHLPCSGASAYSGHTMAKKPVVVAWMEIE